MRDERAALHDILDATSDAAAIVARGRQVFDSDRIVQRGAKNLLAELGEAAKRLPDDLLARMDAVPWTAVKGMREKVVHDYPELDLDVVWSTLARGAPDVERAVRRVFGADDVSEA